MFKAGSYRVRLSKEARPIVEEAFVPQCQDDAQFEAMTKKLARTLKSFLNQGKLPPDSEAASHLRHPVGAVFVAPLWGVQVAFCIDDTHLEIHIVGAA